jgi:nicotinamidase/pyrazinamidase
MKKYLIIVDIQNDFTQEDGSLYVAGSKKAIQSINQMMVKNSYEKIILTQDYHPDNHISFASTHGKPIFTEINAKYGKQFLWPDHCIAGTWGADIDAALDIEKVDIIWRKGTRKEVDSYSAFLENDSSSTLLESFFIGEFRSHTPEIDIVGVATDVCVYNTAKDCMTLLPDAKVTVHLNGCAGVNEENTKNAIEDLLKRGVKIKDKLSLAEVGVIPND